MSKTAAVEALISFYEGLSAESLARFPEFYADDAFFKDPFNQVRGVAPIQRIFAHLFWQVGEPRFVVHEQLVADNGAMLVWEMHFRLPGRRGQGQAQAQVIRGVSHLKFDDEGKVVWHRDYWDAAEELYAKLPAIGWLMRFLQRKLAA
ncbi:nuclear transport factor 2 family protein [Accumulibacter sp.]|uniref:nuclear transport factor 2 family protein n=1 Tax=Accumulibacter sp. TaxID=2053492 RepID=UPI0028C418EA|nr:nuclear transport factor 2 family protein [Accumulibacter sp.]